MRLLTTATVIKTAATASATFALLSLIETTLRSQLDALASRGRILVSCELPLGLNAQFFEHLLRQRRLVAYAAMLASTVTPATVVRR